MRAPLTSHGIFVLFYNDMTTLSLHTYYACRPVLGHLSAYYYGNFLCCGFIRTELVFN